MPLLFTTRARKQARTTVYLLQYNPLAVYSARHAALTSLTPVPSTIFASTT